MKEKIEYLKSIDTGIIVDAMDALGLKGCIAGVFPLEPSSKAVGPAATAQFNYVIDQNVENYASYDVIDGCRQGEVLVFAGGAKERVIGGNMVGAGKMKGLAGFVTDGKTRDVDEILATGFPVFCCGVQIYANSPYLKLTGVNVPVICNGVRIHPGDIVVADRDGVVVIPAGRLDDVIFQCAHVQECEQEMQLILAGKKPLSEAKNILKKKKSLRARG